MTKLSLITDWLLPNLHTNAALAKLPLFRTVFSAR